MGWIKRNGLMAFAVLVVIYMLLPIAIIILFSFNDPAGRYNFTWVGFTLDHWKNAFSIPELNDALVKSLRAGRPRDCDRDRARNDDRPRARPLRVLRPPHGELPDRDPDGDTRGRDRRGAAVAVPGLRDRARAS